MSKLVSAICAALMLVLVATGAATAGERGGAFNATYMPGASPRDALFQQVNSKPCCYNSGEYFQTTPSTCRKYGGQVAPFEYCQRSYYQPWNNGGQNYSYGDKPCCYNDGRFYHSSAKNCSKFGGRVVALDYCRRNYNQPWGDGYNDSYGYNNNQGFGNSKPCCYNNGQYFHSTPSTCRKYGGYTVPYEYCTPRRW